MAARVTRTAGIIAGVLVYQWYRRGGWRRCHRTVAHAKSVLWPESLALEADEILTEQLSRSTAFHGERGHERVARGCAVIVGLSSGVASSLAVMLCRGGVRRIHLVGAQRLSDVRLDAVCRRAGEHVAMAVRREMLGIMPGAEVHCWAGEELHAAGGVRPALERVLQREGSGAIVVDCLQHADSKAVVGRACAAVGAPLLTMGCVRGRTDLTRLHVGTLSDAVCDPLLLAATKNGGPMPESTRIIFSTEPCVPCEEPHGAVVAGFAQLAAAVCETHLAGVGSVPCRPAPRLCKLVRNDLHGDWVQREEDSWGTQEADLLSAEAIELVCLVGWHMRCAVTAEAYSCRRRNLAVVRWNAAAPPAMDNLVLVSRALLEEGDGRCVVHWPQMDAVQRQAIDAVRSWLAQSTDCT